MTGTTTRSGLDLRVAIVLGVIAALVFGGVAVFAASVNGELERTRSTVNETTAELASTTASLSDTRAKLTTATTDFGTETKAIEAANAKITVLEFQVERKAACIAVQATNLTELRRILALERENFARTTSGSTWAKANAAATKAMHLAITDLYKSYQAAAAGKYGTANTWLARSNAQISILNKQAKAGNKEVTRINAASGAINKANSAFQVTLDDAQSTCGG
jgi:septal ring factor EnvC (AmiA/AmiB activator)